MEKWSKVVAFSGAPPEELYEFDLEFDLKFEISDGKKLVKFGGRTFLPAKKAREISERISGQISEQISGQISGQFLETSFQISRLFRKLRSAEGQCQKTNPVAFLQYRHETAH